MIKIRNIKHKYPKFFGFKEDRWARQRGSYKGSYGHFGNYLCDSRTKLEKLHSVIKKELQS